MVILVIWSSSRARLFQQHLDIGHGLFGLAGHVADGHAFVGVEILADLAAHEHHRPVRDHDLAEIIVELLLRIGFPGVELADAGMNWHDLASGRVCAAG